MRGEIEKSWSEAARRAALLARRLLASRRTGPQRMYHGTLREFDEFSDTALRSRPSDMGGDAVLGHFFTTSPVRASNYAYGMGGNIRPVTLHPTKMRTFRGPETALYRLTPERAQAYREALLARGYDALKVPISRMPVGANTEDWMIALKPTIIRSVFKMQTETIDKSHPRRSGVGISAQMGPKRKPGQRNKRLGRSRIYLAKDITAEDVHIRTALGNEKRKRKVKPMMLFDDTVSVEKAWSEEAREAALEARRNKVRAGSKPLTQVGGKDGEEPIDTGPVFGGALVGGAAGYLGKPVAAGAYKGAHAAARKVAEAGAKRGASRSTGAAAKMEEKIKRAENLAAKPGSAGEGAAARAGAERLKEKLKSTPGYKPGSAGWARTGRAGARTAEALANPATLKRVVGVLRHSGKIGAGIGAALGAYSVYQHERDKRQVVAKLFDESQHPRDEDGRWRPAGEGEQIGRVVGGGLGAGAAAAQLGLTYGTRLGRAGVARAAGLVDAGVAQAATQGGRIFGRRAANFAGRIAARTKIGRLVIAGSSALGAAGAISGGISAGEAEGRRLDEKEAKAKRKSGKAEFAGAVIGATAGRSAEQFARTAAKKVIGLTGIDTAIPVGSTSLDPVSSVAGAAAKHAARPASERLGRFIGRKIDEKVKKAFNESQARDEYGRWTSTERGEQIGATTGTALGVAGVAGQGALLFGTKNRRASTRRTVDFVGNLARGLAPDATRSFKDEKTARKVKRIDELLRRGATPGEKAAAQEALNRIRAAGGFKDAGLVARIGSRILRSRRFAPIALGAAVLGAGAATIHGSRSYGRAIGQATAEEAHDPESGYRPGKHEFAADVIGGTVSGEAAGLVASSMFPVLGRRYGLPTALGGTLAAGYGTMAAIDRTANRIGRKLDERDRVRKFDEGEHPRDAHGRWTVEDEAEHRMRVSRAMQSKNRNLKQAEGFRMARRPKLAEQAEERAKEHGRRAMRAYAYRGLRQKEMGFGEKVRRYGGGALGGAAGAIVGATGVGGVAAGFARREQRYRMGESKMPKIEAAAGILPPVGAIYGFKVGRRIASGGFFKSYNPDQKRDEKGRWTAGQIARAALAGAAVAGVGTLAVLSHRARAAKWAKAYAENMMRARRLRLPRPRVKDLHEAKPGAAQAKRAERRSKNINRRNQRRGKGGFGDIPTVEKSYSPDQPRDEQGRFASWGADLGRSGGGIAGIGGGIATAALTNKWLQTRSPRRLKRYAAAGAAGIAAFQASKEIGQWTGRKLGQGVDYLMKSSVEETMGEFKRGNLHSGSKKGPVVTDRKQAIAIALDTARREGLEKAWSEEAREAALEARRGRMSRQDRVAGDRAYFARQMKDAKTKRDAEGRSIMRSAATGGAIGGTAGAAAGGALAGVGIAQARRELMANPRMREGMKHVPWKTLAAKYALRGAGKYGVKGALLGAGAGALYGALGTNFGKQLFDERMAT